MPTEPQYTQSYINNYTTIVSVAPRYQHNITDASASTSLVGQKYSGDICTSFTSGSS